MVVPVHDIIGRIVDRHDEAAALFPFMTILFLGDFDRPAQIMVAAHRDPDHDLIGAGVFGAVNLARIVVRSFGPSTIWGA